MSRTKTIARQLLELKGATQALLAEAGRISEQYDSARLSEALGHLSAAYQALDTAHAVRWAQERRGE